MSGMPPTMSITAKRIRKALPIWARSNMLRRWGGMRERSPEPRSGAAHPAADQPLHGRRIVEMLQRMYPCGECFGRVAQVDGTFDLQQVLALVVPLVHVVDGDATFLLVVGDDRPVHMRPIHALAPVLGQ